MPAAQNRNTPPDTITTKRVLIDGKETGIDHLDWIFEEVTKLAVENDTGLTEEILKRVKQFNYIPTKKTAEYGSGLLAAYRKFRKNVHDFGGRHYIQRVLSGWPLQETEPVPTGPGVPTSPRISPSAWETVCGERNRHLHYLGSLLHADTDGMHGDTCHGGKGSRSRF